MASNTYYSNQVVAVPRLDSTPRQRGELLAALLDAFTPHDEVAVGSVTLSQVTVFATTTARPLSGDDLGAVHARVAPMLAPGTKLTLSHFTFAFQQSVTSTATSSCGRDALSEFAELTFREVNS